MSEEALPKSIVLGFIKGKKRDIEKVYLAYKNLMFFVIAIYVDNQEDCQDILSEAFLKAIEHAKEIEDPLKLKTYLATIAKNQALDFLKKKKEAQVFENLDEMYGEEDKTNSLLNDFEYILTNKETIVVYLKAGFGYTWKEIEEETSIPQTSAKRIYNNAKEKLRKEILE